MAKGPKNGERLCPQCKEIIKVDAVICKHCRAEFSQEDVAAAVSADKKKTQYTAMGCLGLLLLMGSCVAILGKEDKVEVAEKPAATAKVDAIAFFHSITGAMAECDAAGIHVAEVGKGMDPVAMYQAASGMESACTGTSRDVDAIEVPTSVGKDAYAALRKGREACSNAALMRWSGAMAMKEALDGGSVGKLAALQDRADAMSSGTMLCALGLVQGTASVGVTSKDLATAK